MFDPSESYKRRDGDEVKESKFDLIQALEYLQEFLDRRGYLSQTEGLVKADNYSLYDAAGDIIASGGDIEELLVNLVSVKKIEELLINFIKPKEKHIVVRENVRDVLLWQEGRSNAEAFQQGILKKVTIEWEE